MGVHWYVAKSGREVGPLTWAELRDLAAAGQLGPDDPVRPDGVGDPRRAADVPGLLELPLPSEPARADIAEPPQFYLCRPGGPGESEGPFTADELRAHVPTDLAPAVLVNRVGTSEWRPLDQFPEARPRPEGDAFAEYGVLAAVVGTVVGWLGVVFRSHLVEGTEGFWAASLNGLISGAIVGVVGGALAAAAPAHWARPLARRGIAGFRWATVAAASGAVAGALCGGPGWWRLGWLVAGAGMGFALSRGPGMRRLCEWVVQQQGKTHPATTAAGPNPAHEAPAPAWGATGGQADPAEMTFKLTATLAAAVPVLAVWAYRRAFYAGAGWDAGDLIDQVGATLCVGAVVAATVFWAATGLKYVFGRRRGVTRSDWLRRPDLAVAVGSVIGVVVAVGWVTLNHRTLSEKRDFQASEVYRAVRFQAKGEHAKALEEFGVALQDLPPSADIYLLRAQSHLAVGDPDKALTDLDEAIRLRPADSVANTLRAMAHEKKGVTSGARPDQGKADQVTHPTK